MGFPRVLVPWALQMSCNPSDLPFQMPSTRGAGSHIWQSRAGANLAGAALAASVALLRPGWGAGLACKLQKPRGLASQTREPRSPFPIPIPVPSAPCLVASSSGITHVLASAAVSQEVANLSSLG